MRRAAAWAGLIALGLFIAVCSARGKLGVLTAVMFAPDEITVTDES
jgi:hypothetical protein